MKALWVDPANGCAGDMLLAALLDAGADLDVVRAGLARLAVEPIAVEPAVVRRHGFRALLANVSAVDAAVQRALPDIVKVLDPLPSPVRDFAQATFTRLADAEARVTASRSSRCTSTRSARSTPSLTWSAARSPSTTSACWCRA